MPSNLKRNKHINFISRSREKFSKESRFSFQKEVPKQQTNENENNDFHRPSLFGNINKPQAENNNAVEGAGVSSVVQDNDRYKQVIIDQEIQSENSKLLSEDEIKHAEKDFLNRRQSVKKTCYKYGLGIHALPGRPKTLRYPPSANYDVLYIDG